MSDLSPSRTIDAELDMQKTTIHNNITIITLACIVLFKLIVVKYISCYPDRRDDTLEIKSWQ
jgi:hypothetical protein